jgi:hypothetical protein
MLVRLKVAPLSSAAVQLLHDAKRIGKASLVQASIINSKAPRPQAAAVGSSHLHVHS